MYATRSTTARKLLPLYDPESAVELPINLGANGTYARGTVLGQVTSAANDVQTLTVTGTPTGGSITITLTHPITGETDTFTVDFDNSTAETQSAIRASIIGANVTVTGAGVLPGNTHIFTFNTDLASIPVPLMTVSTNALTGGSSPAATIAHTTVGKTANTFDTYADGGSGGLDTARCILAYDCVTDSGGNITLGTVAAGAGERGYTTKDVPAYFVGIFKVTDLTGLTAAAVADLGRLMSGAYNSTDGVLSVG